MGADNKPSSLRKAGLLFALFILPSILCLSFYYFMVREPLIKHPTKEKYKDLRYLGPRMVDEKGDTIYHTVKPFVLTDQLGKPFSSESLKGKTTVVSFFSVNETDTCFRCGASLYRVQEKMDYLKNFRIISIALNPGADPVVNCKDFATKVHANSKVWSMLSGPSDQVMRIATFGFGLKRYEADPKRGFTHKLFLLDPDHHIRGEYDGTQLGEVNKLMDEIKVVNALYRIK